MKKYLVNTWDGQRVKENRKEGLCEENISETSVVLH